MGYNLALARSRLVVGDKNIPINGPDWESTNQIIEKSREILRFSILCEYLKMGK